MGGPSTEEIFAAMKQAVEADPSLASKFNASVVFVVGDQTFRLDATKGTPKKDPELAVTFTLDVLHELLAKKLTPQQAFMKGKLKIRGNMGLAMKLQLILNGTRKLLGGGGGGEENPHSRL
jgi:putative sterol carrier protein